MLEELQNEPDVPSISERYLYRLLLSLYIMVINICFSNWRPSLKYRDEPVFRIPVRIRLNQTKYYPKRVDWNKLLNAVLDTNNR